MKLKFDETKSEVWYTVKKDDIEIGQIRYAEAGYWYFYAITKNVAGSLPTVLQQEDMVQICEKITELNKAV